MSKAGIFLEKHGVNEWLQGPIAALFSRNKKALQNFTDKFKTILDLQNMDVTPVAIDNNRDPRIKDPNLIKLYHMKVKTLKSAEETDVVVVISGDKFVAAYPIDGYGAYAVPISKTGEVYVKSPMLGGGYEVDWKSFSSGQYAKYAHGIYVIDKTQAKRDIEKINQRSQQKRGDLKLDREQNKQKFDQYGWDRANDPNSYGYKPDAVKADFWPKRGNSRSGTYYDKSGYLPNPNKYRDLLKALKAEAGPTKVLNDAADLYEEITKVLSSKFRANVADVSKAKRLLTGWSGSDLSTTQRRLVDAMDDVLRVLEQANQYKEQAADKDPKSAEWLLQHANDEINRYVKSLVGQIRDSKSILDKFVAEQK